MLSNKELNKGKEDYKELVTRFWEIKKASKRIESKQIAEVILNGGEILNPLNPEWKQFNKKNIELFKKLNYTPNQIERLILAVLETMQELKAYNFGVGIYKQIEKDYANRKNMYLENVDVQTTVGFIYRLDRGQISKLNKKYKGNNTVGLWKANGYEWAVEMALTNKQFYLDALSLYQTKTRDAEWKRIEKIKWKEKKNNGKQHNGN